MGKIVTLDSGTRALEKKAPDAGKTKAHEFDFMLLIVLLLVCAFGIVMLFSASYYYAQSEYDDGLYFVKRQLIFLFLGIGVLIASIFIPYTFYRKVAIPAYLALIVLLTLTLILGYTRLGAQRWFRVGSFSFQPSEFSKVILVAVLANYMTVKKKEMRSFLKGMLPALLYVLPPCVLILFQPNLSTAIILCLVTYLMLFLGGTTAWHRLLLIVTGLVAIFVLIFVQDYRLSRLTTFLDPWADPSAEGYQVVQSLYALGNGGMFGQGINASRQKLLFLPYHESDFIFSIIGEELGFIGCSLLLFAYLFIVYRGFRIAMNCRERFGSLFAAGLSGALAIQVLINVAVVTSSIPATGQTLPFVSYGGTSLLTFLWAMGIVLNISRYTKAEAKNGE